jgi:flagellar biosynthesis protein FlhB
MPENTDNQDEKTEQPTEHRRSEFRRMGDVFQSREITSILILAAGVLALYISGVYIFENMMSLMKDIFNELAVFQTTQENLIQLLIKLLKATGIMLFPVLLALFIASVASSLGQVGFLFSTEVLKFDLDKINPVNGFQRLLSLKSLAATLKAILKLAVIGTVTYFAIKKELTVAPGLVNLTTRETMSYLGTATLRFILEAGVLLLVLALIDYMYERQRYEQRLKMTKQELKQDIREREGDPLVKSRIRSIQRTIATKRMMEAVPKADVIVTNPTHIAVALTYDREEMPAPKLIAKGAGFIAEKIKELAKQHGVPIVVNKPLAQAVFKKMKIGSFIPKELFDATAQVLAYIYKLKGKFKR